MTEVVIVLIIIAILVALGFGLIGMVKGLIRCLSH